jgi:probable F420-dependent oxidoreductase
MRFLFPLPRMLELKATMQPWELKVQGADQIRMTQRADALGYDMVSISEHFLVPTEHLDLSGARYFDATTAQAVLAGATQHMRVNSCVTILPLHDPIVLAKQLATIDWLSSGRLTVTFGVGWLAREFELLGVPFSERGRMSDEYLEAMIELWAQERPSFSGRYVNFSDVAFEPKPVQKPHPEIWIGGDADGPLRRAARFATGWWPFLTKPEDIPMRLDFIRSQPTYDGRPFEVMYGMSTERVGEGHVVQESPRAAAGQSKEHIINRLNEFAELGVTASAVPIPPCRDAEEYMDYAQWVIEEIKPDVA